MYLPAMDIDGLLAEKERIRNLESQEKINAQRSLRYSGKPTTRENVKHDCFSGGDLHKNDADELKDMRFVDLLAAIKEADLERVKSLLAEGVPIENNRALMFAMKHSNYPILKELLRYRAKEISLDQQEASGCTPLLYAIYNSDRAVKHLLKHGASVNIPDAALNYPLTFAICPWCTFVNDPLQPRVSAVALLLKDPAITIYRKICFKKDQQQATHNALQVAKELERIGSNCNNSYRKIGRMLLQHVRFYGPEGGVARGGLRNALPAGVPLDILKKIAASVDYEAAEKEFKL
jgi:hypothetical protein